MLNPTAAITAVAVVAIGATLMLVQPSSPRTLLPAAETFAAAPVEVSGRISGRRGGCDSSSTVSLEGIDRVQSELCFNTWQFTDDRFRGDVRRTTTEDVYTDGSGLVLHISTHVFTDDDGVWRERPEVRAEYAGATVSELPATRVFDGEGAYDGFLAVLEFRETEDGAGENDIHGFIIPSEATAAP